MKIIRNKNNSVLFLAALSLTLMLSCSKEKEEKVLVASARERLLVGEPAKVSLLYDERAIRQIYETLYDYDYFKVPYKISPLLADGAPQISKDGLTYTVKIKQGIRFADDPCFKETKGRGREFTAQDIIYSFEYFAASPPHTRGYFLYYIKDLLAFREESKKQLKKGLDLVTFIKNGEVSGLKLIDKYTIQFNLSTFCPYFIETLTAPGASIIPIEALEYYKKDFNLHPVGTGPFMLKSWGKGENVVLIKNPNYRQDLYPQEGPDAGKQLPLVDKVIIRILPTESERSNAFSKGKLDLYNPDQEAFYDYFPQNKELAPEFKAQNVKVAEMDTPRFMGIMFNMNEPVVGKNKYLRQAITHAFDNAKNAEVFFYAKPLVANWIVPPHVFGSDVSYKSPYKYDLDEAKKLLVKAGYPDGKGLPQLTLLVDNTALMKRVGDFFIDSMSKIGIDVKLEFADTPEKIKRLLDTGKTKADLFVVSELSTYITPEASLRIFYRGNLKYKTDFEGYYNPEYEMLYEKISHMPDNEEKLKVMKRMHDIVIDDYVVIPMSFLVSYRLYYGYVHNYRPHAIMLDRYKYINVDMQEKKQTLKLIPKGG